MNKQVNVLLMGAAFAADLHVDAYNRCPDMAKIVAICDKDRSKVTALAERYNLTNYRIYDDYQKALEDVECDVVDICFPNFLHHEVALAALEKGRHVLIEKPLATTVTGAEEIIAAARQAGKRIYYAEDWLFAPALAKALQLIEEGAIGRLVYIRARECHCGSHSPFTKTIQYCGGGSMVHLGIHPIGFLLSLKEGKWSELVAMTSTGGASNFVHTDMEGEDWAACLIKFQDNTSALLEANFVTSGGMEDVIDFYGTDGCLHVDLTFSSALTCFSIPGVSYSVEKADITTGWSKPAVDEKFNLGYVDEIRHFMECCVNDVDAKTGLRGIDGLEALKVANFIYQSAREGQKIHNPALRD